ncbi:unnamed protein product [Chrysoparadoxa australica]
MKYIKPSTKRKAMLAAMEPQNKPSDLLLDVTVATVNEPKGDVCETPRIVEFLSLEDNSLAVKSTVPIDEPLFQPHPSRVYFEGYEAFGSYSRTVYFRNNDSVNRRIRVLPLDSANFSVSGARAPDAKGELKDSKIAPGMELCVVVTFRPKQVGRYSTDLVVVTEREKFVVPIVATGHRAALDLPDRVAFPSTAVKSSQARTLVVRNIGSCEAKTAFSCTNKVFSVSPSSALVPVGQTLLLEVSFTPQRSQDYVGQLIVSYADGSESVVALSGSAGDVTICLNTRSLTLDPPYIGLCSQATLKIINKSEIPVRFGWKAFANELDEDLERTRLHAELTKMAKLEEGALLTGAMAVLEGELPIAERTGRTWRSERTGQGPEDSEDDYGDAEEWANMLILALPFFLLSRDSFSPFVIALTRPPGNVASLPPALKAQQAALKRKYRQLRRALEEDQMLFADEIFEIRPITGEIWAKSEIEVTVFFRPNTAAEFGCHAYLDVVGRADKIPLWLGGRGIGPKMILSFDVMDVGDVFVNSLHSYDLTLINKGDIPATWNLVPPLNPIGSKFSFEPMAGTLGVGESVVVVATFCSDILGEFCEDFQVHLVGNEVPLTCQLKGHVMGPTFHMNCTEIDFGTVGYGCPVSKDLTLTNTSDISMTWHARIPQDGAYKKREFGLTPCSGTLAPGEECQIVLDLTSTTVKVYECYLSVDVENVGEELLSIPVKVECQVPVIELQEKEIPFGTCFVRFHEMRTLVLNNTSPDLIGLYRFLPQDPSTHALARVVAEPAEGQVPPGGSTEVKIWLTCEMLRQFRLSLTCEILGSTDFPLQCTVSALSRGPMIESDVPALNWGNIESLRDWTKEVVISNPSKIPAPFKTFISSARSKFRVDVRDGVIAPGKEVTLSVTANLDDTVHHSDELHIIVSEGENKKIPLVARGVGTTMWCPENLQEIDFGVVFSSSTSVKKITLENKGRRQQSLRWINVTARDKQMVATAKHKASLKKAQGGHGASKIKEPPEIVPTFTVSPEEVELRPRTAITFTFKGSSTALGSIMEAMVCEIRVGKEKVVRPVFNTNLKAEFVAPLVSFSPPSFSFTYTYQKDEPISLFQEPLTLTNDGQLPLDLTLKTQPPFSVDTWEHDLAPGASATVTVIFDPGYRSDCESHVAQGKLGLHYTGHPQVDSVALRGEVIFPNLEFEFTKVNFGCILNDTAMTKLVKITNTSKIDTPFSWSFLEDTSEASASRQHIPINQVFDILPIRSFLHPGESEEVEFLFYGHANRKFNGRAVCEVEGGPDYNLDLIGEASNVGFRLDKALLDFGCIQFNKHEDGEFTIINCGKVPVPFRISLDQITRPGSVEVSPSSGVVPGALDKRQSALGPNRVTISLRFKPGLPEIVKETIVVEAGHFDPVEFNIYGQGVYPSLAVSLPRDAEVGPLGGPAEEESDLTWSNLVGYARQSLVTQDPNELPPLPEDTPALPGAVTSIGISAERANVREQQTSRAHRGSTHGTARGPPTASSTSALPGAAASASASSSGSKPGTSNKPGTGSNNLIPSHPISFIPLPCLSLLILSSYTPRSLSLSHHPKCFPSSHRLTIMPLTVRGAITPSHFEVEMEANRLAFMKSYQLSISSLVGLLSHITDLSVTSAFFDP